MVVDILHVHHILLYERALTLLWVNRLSQVLHLQLVVLLLILNHIVIGLQGHVLQIDLSQLFLVKYLRSDRVLVLAINDLDAPILYFI